MMSPGLRKLTLTAHVTCSVGWLGAVAGFFALSLAGLTSRNPELVRGAYIAMNLMGGRVIVPLGLAALLTGLIQSLGTHWGLFRHYWVLVKFALTIGATFLLMLHQFTAVAGAARRASGTVAGALPDVGRLGTQLVGDAGFAVLVLLAATTLSVYKPWGPTRYGQRTWRERRRTTRTLAGTPPPECEDGALDGDGAATGERRSRGPGVVLAVVGVFVVIVIVLHLTGRGLGSHGR